jgi:hypothetical protein
MIKKSVIKASVIILFFAVTVYSGDLSGGPYQATGIKIGEVTCDTAIVWTRLTRRPERVGSEAPMPEVSYRNPKTGKIVKKNEGRPNLAPIVNFPEDSCRGRRARSGFCIKLTRFLTGKLPIGKWLIRNAIILVSSY